MDSKILITSIVGTATSAIGTATQTNEILEIISLVLTILGALISFVVIPLLNWYKQAKADGKIDKKEINDGITTIQNGLEEVKNVIDHKEKGDKK